MNLPLPNPMPPGELPENNPPMRLSYCVPRRVLHGGMSLVYLCDTATGAPWKAPVVAVKRLDAEILAMPGTARRFLRECYLWLQIGRHPNVVSALSAHRTDLEAPLLVLEYVPSSLRQTLLAGPVGLSAALRMLIGIADGLAHVRQALPGFVHADLKPENVLVSGEGLAKITDLGLSRVVSGTVDPDQPISAASAGASVSGGGGTPLYVAPEQILDGRAVPESDIYALGCIAYELLSGTPAYGTPVSPADYLLRHLHARPVPLAGRQAEIPSDLRELVQGMLVKAPADRPGLPRILDVLRAVAAGRGEPAPVPVGDAPDPGRLLTAAQGLVNLELYPEARDMAERFIAVAPAAEIPHGRMIMAQAYSNVGRPELADEQLDRAAEIFSADTPPVYWGAYHTERANAANARGDLEAAAEHARAAIQALPTYSRMYANAARIYTRMGRRAEAIEMYIEALLIASDFVYFSGLVNLLREEDRWDEALAVCDRAVQFHPAISQAYVLRAMTHLLHAGHTGMAARRQLRERLVADLASAQRYGEVDSETLAVWHQSIANLSSSAT